MKVPKRGLNTYLEKYSDGHDEDFKEEHLDFDSVEQSVSALPNGVLDFYSGLSTWRAR